MHVFPNSDDPNRTENYKRQSNAIQDLFTRLLQAAEQTHEEHDTEEPEEVVLHAPSDDIQLACQRLQKAMVDIFEELGIPPTNANAVYVTGIISVSILQQGSGYDKPGNEEHTDAIRRFATLITFIHKLNS